MPIEELQLHYSSIGHNHGVGEHPDHAGRSRGKLRWPTGCLATSVRKDGGKSAGMSHEQVSHRDA
jgi:hypothetical protein